MRNTFARTNDGQTPQKAIALSAVFGLLGLLGLADKSFNQPVLTMSAFFTGGVGCVYASECYAFLQFKKGLSHHPHFPPNDLS
jgi:yeast amino acid transporter